MSSASKWLTEVLGENAGDIVHTISTCVAEAHAASSDAQDAGGLRQKTTYGGTMWLRAREEVHSRLVAMGAGSFQPYRAPYRLPVIAETAVFVYRAGTDLSKPMRDSKLNHNPVHREILSLGGRADVESALDFGSIAEDDESWMTPEFATRVTSVKRVLLVPYIDNAEAGLLAAAIGTGRLLLDGSIAWEHYEQLDLELYRAAPQRVVLDEQSPRFDNAALPEPGLSRREHRVERPAEVDLARKESREKASRADNGTDD
jgi:hypothetical protein